MSWLFKNYRKPKKIPKNPIFTTIFILFSLTLLCFHHFSPKTINFIKNSGFSNVGSKIDQCAGRYIYMYDLPAQFNKDLLTNCRKLAEWFDYCPYVENRGFGPYFNGSDSWFETNQFMLSVIFHRRMEKYECLTKNSSLATAIYAPFYPGLQVRRYLDITNLTLRDEGGVAFTSWLRDRPEWARFHGWDHFFVSGRITWDFRRLSYTNNSSWGSSLLDLPESKNMTILAIEASPYVNNDFAVPYPTYFHPSADFEVLDWQNRVKKSKRRFLFAFGGATRSRSTGSIRDELIEQCRNATDKNPCNLVNCRPGDEMCTNPAHFINAYMNSEFCLQPPGDSSTRRSTFDSILAGCIPVFFHPSSAYIQYIWYFPLNYTKYSVFIPSIGIENRTVRVEEVLSKFSKDDILGMRDEVIRLIPKIIYARKKLETVEDAFDIAVKRILERVENSTRQIREGNVPYSGFPEYASWKYYLTGNVGRHEWDSYY